MARLRRPLLALASLLAACLPGARPPAAPARASLSLAPETVVAPPAAPAGPLRVLFAAPRGETERDAEIAVLFSKPMRALGLPATEPPPPVILTPAARGAFRWVGSSALRFDADGRLPRATAFHLEIPAGTRALDGTALDAPFAVDFSTPRPALLGIELEGETTDVLPDAAITLDFNQPVTASEILRAITLRSDRRRDPLPFTIDWQDATRAHILPAQPLPLHDHIHVRADASLHGAEGDLPAGKDREFSFDTLRAPAVTRVACEPAEDEADGACDPDYGRITVELRGAVPARGLLRALHVEPAGAVTLPPADDTPTSELWLDAHAKPGGSLRLWFDPGQARVTDAYGQALAPSAPVLLRFAEPAPRVLLGLGGTYWSGGARHKFRAYLTDTGPVGVNAQPVLVGDVLAGRAVSVHPGWSLVLPPSPPDRTLVADVDLDGILPPDFRGPVVVAADWPARLGTRHEVRRLVQITDIGITARVGHGAAAVLVRGLTLDRPAPDAVVEVYRLGHDGQPAVRLGAARTGPEGDATVALDGSFPADPDQALAVVARIPGDWAYALVDAPRPAPVVGSVYTERMVYRPGETVKVAGVFRVAQRFGLATPRGATVEVEVHGPSGTTIAPPAATLSEFGTFAVDVPVPEGAPLGTYSVRARAAGGEAHRWFGIAEYRPTEIDVEASLDRPAYRRGDTLACAMRGRYLHGGVMRGAPGAMQISRALSSFEVPGHQGWIIADEDRPSPPSSFARHEGALDAQGELAFSVQLAMPDQRGPETVSCSVEATDLNRQSLGASAEAIVHPGEAYVALERSQVWGVAPGKAFAARVITVTPSGERLHLKARVEAVLRARAGAPETSIGACDVTTGEAPASCSFTVPAATRAGTEIVVRASATDRLGNPLSSSYHLGVEAPAPVVPPSPLPQPSPPPPRLEVLAERHQKPGVPGHLTIVSPFSRPSIALVTIEREGILWQRVVHVPGPRAEVEFPVTDAMIPNARAAVMLVSGAEAQDTFADLDVETSSRALEVHIDTAGAAHAPGEEVDVDVTVKDASGKPARAEVTLWAADEGSLLLTDYHVPRLDDALHAERSVLVTEAEARRHLVYLGLGGSHRTRAPMVRMGATQVSPPRGDFRQTVFFAPHLVTDAAGHVRRRVKLPDGLTAYRFLAVAMAEDDRTGSAEETITTSLPLMARASLPRVIRAGDRFEASVVVSSKDLPAGDAEVRATATGLVLAGPATRTVRLDPGAPAEVRFPIRADRAGPAELTIRAALGRARDAMTLKAAVVTPIVPESAAIDGETRDAVAERLGDLGAIRPDYGGLEVTLSSSPIAGLADGIQQLVEYPHGCTEQTVSRLVPLLALSDLARALDAAIPADAEAAVRDGVQRILRNQQRDGGFGLWPESPSSQPWVTAYALWGLGEARRRGAAVPEQALSRARGWLAARIATGDDAEGLALAAFVADVEAEDGHPDAALLARLGKAQDRMPPSGRALLLHALALADGDPAVRAELARSLEALLRIDGAAARAVTAPADAYEANFDSDTRTTALILRALVASDADHPLLPRLAAGLLEARRGGRWRTTQEAAWALLALDALRRAHPPSPAGVEARAFLGDTLLADAPLAGLKTASFSIPAAQLLGGQPLTFAASGGGALHYHARLRYARTGLPADPVEAGFSLERRVRPIGPTPGAVRAGQIVEVQLSVATPSPRHFVVLESPLPGGLEPVDVDLRLGGSWLRDVEAMPPGRRELHDDRVDYFVDELPAGVTTFRYAARATSVGTFVTPPARVEEMYAPETFARTAAETTTVAPP